MIICILSGICGVYIGALAMSLVCNPHVPTSGLASGLATIIVGFWIHRALRRRGELDRVPIDHLSNLNRRVDELISECLNTKTAKEDRLLYLRRLSNEIDWFGFFANWLYPERDGLRDKLKSHYFDFKELLTEDPCSVDWLRASEASHALRGAALRVQWVLCRHILSRRETPDLTSS